MYGTIPYLLLTVYHVTLLHVTIVYSERPSTMVPPWHVCPNCRQPLNLGAQAESGAVPDTGLLLTTRQIGAVGVM